MTLGLGLEQARTIVAAARAKAAEQGFAPLTVVVLDAGAHLIWLEREDGASFGRADLARGKAAGAIAVGMGSRSVMARAEQQPYFVNAAATTFQGQLVPVPGGVLVHDANGVLQGAVGISGDTSDNDEIAAIAGIEAAGLVAKPD